MVDRDDTDIYGKCFLIDDGLMRIRSKAKTKSHLNYGLHMHIVVDQILPQRGERVLLRIHVAEDVGVISGGGCAVSL